MFKVLSKRTLRKAGPNPLRQAGEKLREPVSEEKAGQPAENELATPVKIQRAFVGWLSGLRLFHIIDGSDCLPGISHKYMRVRSGPAVGSTRSFEFRRKEGAASIQA